MQTPDDLRNAVRPYSLTDHIHEREASYRLGTLLSDRTNPFSVSFIPTVASWFSGIISVANVPLKQTMRADDVFKLYEEKYGKEPLVSINRKGVPDVKDAEGRHGWNMGGVQVHSGGKRVVVVATLDNLLKGAATQCMQNLNLALGYDELAGIPKDQI
jgi:N-acetyl-gamma-glutamyl-phosphate reductase / acetylglutamate kinase